MQKITSLIFACVTAAILTGCATGNSFVRPGHNFKETGRVAVLTNSSVLTDEQKKEIADLFSMEMLKRGYDVVDRANLDQIMTEVSFQNESGLTSSDGRSKLAVKNIKATVLVNVTEFGDKVSMTAKMVDVGTGSLLWMGEGTGSLKSGLGTLTGAVLGAAVGTAAGHQVKHSGSSRLAGAAAGGLVGGIAGKALEPEQANLVRKVINKVTEELPSLIPEK